MRAADDKHGAFFAHVGDKWSLIACEDERMKPSFLFDYAKTGQGYLVLAGSAGGPSVISNYYELRNSKLVSSMNVLYVYGEIEECSMNGKEISHATAQKHLDAMPKVNEVAVYWQPFTDKQKD